MPADVVLSVFKTTPKQMAEVAKSKLQHGSDRAVCIGGNNAHAANIVAAVFLATGQVSFRREFDEPLFYLVTQLLVSDFTHRVKLHTDAR
ncbi:unnamed protein product [Heligmosomoides polygyrus]|uniref:Uncharacterized protein n=1 Tax=Heligmosomoides polygyrus TaxID=6339 RepID=A0A3P7WA23_HELPZ|nr:unnamed protein product [Heligmosomoides polygyrus]